MKLAHFASIALVSCSAIFSSLENPEALSRVLETATNVDVVEASYHMTPLMWAAQNGLGASASLLLRRGASVHTRDVDDYTPLVHAVINGHLSIVTELVDAGSNVAHVTSDKGNNALMWACGYGHADVALYLIDHCDVACLNQRGSGGGTALHLAARSSGMAEVIKKIIHKGGYYRLKCGDGNEPMMLAAHAGSSTNIAAFLEARGPSVNGVVCSDVIGAKAIAQHKGLTHIISLIDEWLGPQNRVSVSLVL